MTSMFLQLVCILTILNKTHRKTYSITENYVCNPLNTISYQFITKKMGYNVTYLLDNINKIIYSS